MRKTAIIVWLHLDSWDGFVPNVQLVNILRVFLQEMHYLDCGPNVPISTHIKRWSITLCYWLSCGRHSSSSTTCITAWSILRSTHSLSLWTTGTFVTYVAKTNFFMLNVFRKRIDLFALFITLESEVHENVLKNLVLLIECVDLVANGALIFSIWNIFARCLRESWKAFLATELMTMSTFQHFCTNHHARWAFKILRELVQHILRVEVQIDQRYNRATGALHF